MKLLLIAVLALVASTTMAQSNPFLGEDMEPGFIKIRDDGSDLFYWMFRSRSSTKDTDPLVFWLSGGPGCSSELAVFYENGPFKVNPDLTLTKNQYSWNNAANVVYMDQPVGTGYSKNVNPSDLDKTEGQIAKDFYTFLLGFYAKHPEFKQRSLFITGESYAGHYIPAISAYIVAQKNADITLVASAIGNGMTDPYNQYPEYVTFALENNLISNTTAALERKAMAVCQKLIASGQKALAMQECETALTPIIGGGSVPRFNLYDIRLPCSHPPLCYDFSNMDKFLARKDVIQILGVAGRQFEDCNGPVHEALTDDWFTSLQQNVTYLLENNVHLLVYSGDKDFICNWRGGEKWTNVANWSHQAEFANASYQNWNNKDGSVSFGQFKSVDKLTFLRVYNAGHMVPMDQPQASLSMLTRFFGNWHLEHMAKLASEKKTATPEITGESKLLENLVSVRAMVHEAKKWMAKKASDFLKRKN